MDNAPLPVAQCDVLDKESLSKYRLKAEKWWRWLKTDDHHALWPQIYSMLIGDMTFRTLAAAAEADQESALYSPIIMRGLLQGYAATQGLAIRRLVDKTKNVISLQKLLDDIRNNVRLLTRENYVSGDGTPYDPNAAMQNFLTDSNTEVSWAPNTGSKAFGTSMQAHEAFDRLTDTQPQARSRTDTIPRSLIEKINTWLIVSEIGDVVAWSNMRIAHTADQASHQNVDLARITPNMIKISTAQKHIVRATEAVSACLLRGPIHGNIIPVFQFNQFLRFERLVHDRQVVKIAEDKWFELASERNKWTDGIWNDLIEKNH